MGKMKEMAQAWKDLEVDKDKLKQIRQELQEYKRKKQMANQAMQGSYGTSSPVAQRRSRPQRQRPKLDILKEELSRMDDRKAKLAETIKKLEALPFKPGDVAVHPEFGNVLISDVFVPGESDGMMLMDHLDVNEPTALIFIPGAHGAEPVPISELVPHNDTSKVLYAQK